MLASHSSKVNWLAAMLLPTVFFMASGAHVVGLGVLVKVTVGLLPLLTVMLPDFTPLPLVPLVICHLAV